MGVLTASKIIELMQTLTCRASIPVFTCLLSIAFEHKIPTRQEGLALLVLTVGVMIAMWKNNIAGTPMAISLCLMGTICNAGMMSLSGKVLSEKVDALQLAFYTAPVSFTAIMPVFLWREVNHPGPTYLLPLPRTQPSPYSHLKICWQILQLKQLWLVETSSIVMPTDKTAML